MQVVLSGFSMRCMFCPGKTMLVWFFCSVPAITARMDMGLYEVLLSMSLLGFGMGNMLANVNVWYYVLNMRVKEGLCALSA